MIVISSAKSTRLLNDAENFYAASRQRISLQRQYYLPSPTIGLRDIPKQLAQIRLELVDANESSNYIDRVENKHVRSKINAVMKTKGKKKKTKTSTRLLSPRIPRDNPTTKNQQLSVF